MVDKPVSRFFLLACGICLLTSPISPADDPLPPHKRVLNAVQAKRVAELQSEIESLSAAGKFEEAMKPAEEGLRIRTAAQGKDHWETVNVRYGVEALKALSKQSATDRELSLSLGKLDTDADALTQKGLHAQAQATYEKALAIRRKLLGEEHPQTASSYNLVALNLNMQGKHAEARPLLEKALAIRRKVLGEEHPETGQSYNNVAGNLSDQGKHAEARPLLEKALEIRRKVQGEQHAATANGYNNLAFNLDAQGKHAQAQPLYEKALAINREVLGEQHPLTANSYNNAGSNLNAQNKYAEAGHLYEKALAINRKVRGEEHPATATSYNNVAHNFADQGMYVEARPLLHKALAIYRKVLGEEHPHTATSYDNVASNLNALGKYAESQPLLEKALAIRRRVLGEEHPDTATSYNNVAYNLMAQGKYAEARPHYAKAVAIYREILGEEHAADAANCYNNAAFNLIVLEKYAEAQALCEKALAIYRGLSGKEHDGTATSYNKIALNLSAQGKYAEARPFFEKSLAIGRKVRGEEHPHTATGYNNLAHNLTNQEMHAEAHPVFEKALAIRRKMRGEDHPDTANAYNQLALSLHTQGKTREAIPFWQSACNALDRARLHVADTGFDRGQFMTDFVSPHAALALGLAHVHEPRQAWHHAEAYFARGLLDDLDPMSRQSIEAPARLAKLDELLVPLLSRANLSAEERDRRDAFQKESQSLRKALSDAAAERSAKRIWSLERIQASLPPNAAFVFWLDVRKDHWACIVKREGQPIWRRLQGTGPDHAWTSDDLRLSKLTYDALIQANPSNSDNLLAALRAQRLDPLLTHLHGIDRLFVIPTGDMAKVPLEALTDRFIVSYTPLASVFAQLRQQHRPISGSTLLALGNPVFTPASRPTSKPPSHGMLITTVVPKGNADKHGLQAGDILLSYNNKPLNTLDDLKAVSEGGYVRAEYWREGKTHPLRLDPGRLGVALDKRPIADAYASWVQSAYTQVAQRDEPYASLPGTKVEVSSLAKLVPDAKVLLGSDASEQSLEQLAETGQLKNFRLLHFATHGVVNEGIPTETALILAQDRISQKLDDQLARTLGGKKPLDGRLTVGTILEKWQLDADQVVLSACETGLGAQAGGEGLLGFAQALIQKGAKSVVLSRWKVPDAATALLMQRYYENILGKRPGLKALMGRADGLREAKTWLRNLTQSEIEKQVLGLANGGELRSVKKAVPVVPGKPVDSDRPFAAPYYWAAFVLIGDPE